MAGRTTQQMWFSKQQKDFLWIKSKPGAGVLPFDKSGYWLWKVPQRQLRRGMKYMMRRTYTGRDQIALKILIEDCTTQVFGKSLVWKNLMPVPEWARNILFVIEGAWATNDYRWTNTLILTILFRKLWNRAKSVRKSERYKSLPICVLDCVYSLRTKYFAVTVPVLQRYADTYMGGNLYAGQDTLSDFITHIKGIEQCSEFARLLLKKIIKS